MTLGKYKRLLLILTVPLLILGFALTKFLIAPYNSATIICTKFASEHCISITEDPWAERVESFKSRYLPVRADSSKVENLEWVEIWGIDASFPLSYSWPYASPRVVFGAVMTDVRHYIGANEATVLHVERLKERIDESIILYLGSRIEDLSSTYALSGCNLLKFDNESFRTRCLYTEGMFEVEFSVGSDSPSAKALATLHNGITEQINRSREGILLHYAVGVPIPLVIFLFLSGLVWVVRKSIKYVAAG